MINVEVQNRVIQQVAEKVCGFSGKPIDVRVVSWIGMDDEMDLYDIIEQEVWSNLPVELEEMAERHEYDAHVTSDISAWVMDTASKATEVAEMLMD